MPKKKVYLSDYRSLIKQHGKSTADAILRQVRKLEIETDGLENGSEIQMQGFKLSVWNHEDRSMLEGMFVGFTKK